MKRRFCSAVYTWLLCNSVLGWISPLLALIESIRSITGFCIIVMKCTTWPKVYGHPSLHTLVLVWVCFPVGSIERKKLNVTPYNDILDNSMLRFVFDPFLFQHDNAPSTKPEKYSLHFGVEELDWP